MRERVTEGPPWPLLSKTSQPLAILAVRVTPPMIKKPEFYDTPVYPRSDYYCKECETWFSCFVTWEEHMFSKRHRQNCEAKNLPVQPPPKPLDKLDTTVPWRRDGPFKLQ